MSAERWFPSTYQEARARFRAALDTVRARWPSARLEQHPLRDHPDLTMDCIQAEACERPRWRIILSAGQHGIEGEVGAAMIQYFLAEILPHLDPAEVGLTLIFPINPWGMAHRRRVNAQNVDLNRNFLTPEAFRTAPDLNPAYAHLHDLLNPQGPISSYNRALGTWWPRLVKTLISPGLAHLRAATLLGQYRFPQGIFYGGDRLQEENEVLAGILRQAWQGYEQVIHMDFHTGYGPRGQLTLVNSPLDPRPPSEYQRLFGYPHVVATEPGAFYTIQGDMRDWIYRTLPSEAPDARFYVTAFEFGTLGDRPLAVLRSLQALVFENQAYWHGASPAAQRRIDQAFLALFAPRDPTWRQGAIAQARQAFIGVLRAFGVWQAA